MSCVLLSAGPIHNSLLTCTFEQLVEPINQTAEEEAVIPGLCAFLLGVCYEFNREPGEVTRYAAFLPLAQWGVLMSRQRDRPSDLDAPRHRHALRPHHALAG